jgi:TonB family protein
MNSLLLFLVKSTLSLSLLYLAFSVLMRKETFFQLNRIVLLFMVLSSLLIPFLSIPQPIHERIPVKMEPIFQVSPILEEPVSTIEAPAILQPAVPAPETVQPVSIPIRTIVIFVYLSGVLVSFLMFIYSIGSVLLLFRKARKTILHGIRIRVVDHDIPAFSFGRNILVSQYDFDTSYEAIITHEQSHIKLGHFYDLMLMELVKIIFWFNPLVYRMVNDLKEIHEFQADDHTLHSGIDATQYQILIIQKGVGHQKFALANSFNHCQIKNRITMMNKQKTSKAGLWKVATFLPLLALLLMAFGNGSKTLIKNEMRNETANILQADLKEDNQTIDNGVISVPSELNLVLNDQMKEETAISDVKQESQKVIKGKVIDEYGNALEGVSVVGSKRMKTTTDANGNFEIAMTEDLPLWFSHAGLRRTVRTPPEFEESTIVKMEPDPLDLGGNATKAVRTVTVTKYYQSKNKFQKKEQTIQAEEKTVMGKVVDANEKPLEGASVVVSGKTIGTATDKEGHFKLNLTDTSSIVISYVGFKSVKVMPAFKKSMKIKMEPKNVDMDKVVVVGYGIQKKQESATKGSNNEGNLNSGNKEIFTIVEQMPEFPGGKLALGKYIIQQIKYPASAQEAGIQGNVFVSFVINRFGVPSNVTITKSVNPALDNEAIRVVYTMPKWKPGFQQGKAVDVAYTMPIEFLLQYDPPQPLVK